MTSVPFPFKQRELRRICKKQIERVFFLPSYIYNNQLDTSIQVEFAHPLQTRPFVFFLGEAIFFARESFPSEGGLGSAARRVRKVPRLEL